jgi:transcriptional regulator GlxA family with amidase domain
MNSPSPRRIGFVCFDGLTALDLVGPLEVFGNANDLSDHGSPIYQTALVAPTLAPCASDIGLILQPHFAFADAGRFDTIVVPGGPGLREPALNATVAAWLSREAPHTRRLVSVCTGLYGLAATGLLDGRRAATHWRFAADAAVRFTAVGIDADSLYLEDPPFFISAGVTAGVDLALAMVEHDHGPGLALKVARELVVYFKRPGGQRQFSEPLRFQARAADRFADLVAWLPDHLQEDVTVAALARRVNMGARHFARAFRAAFGLTPGDYVEALRLDHARQRLGARNQTVESVGHSLGFRSADVFRRAFERRYAVTPSAYRAHFATEARAAAGAPG